MKKKNKLGKYEKGVIITGVVVALILLILLTADGIKNIGKNNNPVGLSEQGENIVDTPNAPTLSAGMIPVKYNGDNLIICQNDNSWYNYSDGKPAYMMLNDGVYQSELAHDMTNKKLASKNIGQVVQPNEQGSIYMWMPRYTINTKTEEIKYIEPEATLGGDFEVSDTFMYKQTDEMKPDYSLSGIWVEKTPGDVSKISRMTGEENTYGFIANTIGIAYSNNANISTTVEEYIANFVGADGSACPIIDITNANRTIIKIISDKYHEPIKGKIAYNEAEGTVEVTITYNKYEITTIEDREGNSVSFINENGIIKATAKAKSGKNNFTITDEKGNKKKVEVTVELPVYAALYNNDASGKERTLVFTSSNRIIEGKSAYGYWQYGDITKTNKIPWMDKRSSITRIDIADEIAPVSVSYWFSDLCYVTNIDNINNLDTSNINDMSRMFYNCNNLKELDLSNFNTSNVTDTSGMFYDCGNLTKLDLSSFDTSNITNMESMFTQCYNLKELDLSNFDTSNVTNMNYVFAYCTSLTSIDLSNWDTRNVTSMYGMFQECSSLTELDLSSFNTINVTNMTNMIIYCTNLKTIYVGKNWKMAPSCDNWLYKCGTNTTTLKE